MIDPTRKNKALCRALSKGLLKTNYEIKSQNLNFSFIQSLISSVNDRGLGFFLISPIQNRLRQHPMVEQCVDFARFRPAPPIALTL